MADDAQLQIWLTEAENAEHALATGQQIVSVDYEGHSHEYGRASLPELRRHIRNLNRRLGNSPQSGNVRVTF
ncbi:MAG: hypothetical protein GY717_06905 [Rhodobacteraceae bacterium]|nr:hypothetical protein [Paracoccaceae bacterium]